MFKTRIIAVTENLYCIFRLSYYSCSYILRTSQGIFLIDAGMNSAGEDMLMGLKEMGANIRDVRAILLTHWHNDHSAGANILQKMSGAKVYFHQNETEYFLRRTAAKGIKGAISDLIPEMGILVLLKGLLGGAPAQMIDADHHITDNEIIEEDFQVISSPGHTEGHICYYYRPSRILFAGDALAVIDNSVRFMSRFVTPDLQAARRSMLRCLSLDIDYLCPGHREPLTINTNEQCKKMYKQIASSDHWPLFG